MVPAPRTHITLGTTDVDICPRRYNRQIRNIRAPSLSKEGSVAPERMDMRHGMRTATLPCQWKDRGESLEKDENSMLFCIELFEELDHSCGAAAASRYLRFCFTQSPLETLKHLGIQRNMTSCRAVRTIASARSSAS